MARKKPDDEKVIEAIRAYKDEAESARLTRDRLNKRNWDAYHSRQDWTHKTPAQSREFSPRTSMGIESVTAFIKRALTGFGNFFSMELTDERIMDSLMARELLKFHLSSEETDFVTKLTDGIKVALLSSLMIFKVHSGVKRDNFELFFDVEKPEYYYPDPSGRGLYEIQEIVRDLYRVKEGAKDGIYDKKEVEKIENDFVEQEKLWEEQRQRGQDSPNQPQFRKRVTLHEFHGTLLDKEGNVLMENAIATLANNKYLIRKAEPNPFLHGKSPFVTSPIIRVPNSVWHKALYDDAVRINLFINELQNLMMDGGMAAAQNVKVLRHTFLEKQEQASGGIAPGTTLLAKEDMPANMRLLETLPTGNVPADSFNMLNVASRDFDMASLFNDIKAGLLPPRQVKATEIIEKEQASSQLLDGFARTVEKAIEKCLRLAWSQIMQNRDNYNDINHVVGNNAAVTLSEMTPEERHEMFATKTKFKVNGISSIITKGRNFQKLMVAVDLIFKNPVLVQSFAKRFSPEKIIDQIFEGLDLNPQSVELERNEAPIEGGDIERLFGSGKGQGDNAGAPFRNPFPAEVFPSGREAT